MGREERENTRNKPRSNFNPRAKEMKIVIADSTAGRVIGKKGDVVKRIQTVIH